MGDEKIVRWGSRGIGLDSVPGCFVCGTDRRNDGGWHGECLHNVCAFVSVADKDASLACFERGARMAYYHGDPDAPQIKVGACDAHLEALKALSAQWFISRSRVDTLVRHTLQWDELRKRDRERDAAKASESNAR